MNEETPSKGKDFIREIIDADLASGKHQRIVTRFPPEPNGYLHIGHAKSICLNFGIAQEYPNAKCHLRFDDTNPAKEDVEYVDSIQEDVRWLGFDWAENMFYASDYFPRLHQFAIQLIQKGKAYVCDLSPEETREYRGNLSEPGRDSPYRNRSVEENLLLFEKMKNGEFEEGRCTLRAKIDMASPNINMRDPAMYRIKKASHHRTGAEWCIYPMYDFAHCVSDSLEGITHSLCTLEFEHHRPLYDWYLEELGVPCHPRQIEFARLNLSYTVMSKRFLLQLVQHGRVEGWDDPRMPTISGLRRRGFTPEAIRNFCQRIGMTKYNGVTDLALLEFSQREHLNKTASRAFAVLRPLKVIITNYPEGQCEQIEAANNPEDPESGKRQLPFARDIYIEQDDFMEDPPKKFYRLGPGREVRLRYAYCITCQEVIRDSLGQISELRCTYDPQSGGGTTSDGRKVQGIIHWVSATHAVEATVHLYDRLFTVEEPQGNMEDSMNPEAKVTLQGCKLEPGLASAAPGDRFQFERLGYFCADKLSAPDKLIFNRTVTLKDSWAKIAAKT